MQPIDPKHTYNLVLSLVVNGHDTDLTNIIKVTGCSQFAIQEALPLLWDYAKNSKMGEFHKLHALRTQLASTPLITGHKPQEHT